MKLLLAVCLVWLVGIPLLVLLWAWFTRWREQVQLDKWLRSIPFDPSRLN